MQYRNNMKFAKSLFFSVVSCMLVMGLSDDLYAAEKKIPHGITIGDIDAGGMTEEELMNQANEYVSTVTSKNIELLIDGKELDLSAGELGYYWKNTGIVKEAATYCQEGNIIERYKHEKDVQKEGISYDFEMAVDDDVLRHTLETKGSSYNVYHVNASLTKTAEGFDITPESSGKILDVDDSVKELHEYLMDDWDEKEGRKELKVIKDLPTSTKADCAKVKDMIGTFSTSFSGSSGRNKNLENGMRLLNGITIGVGETISVNSYLEPWTTDNGWVPGGTYVNGKVENTLGGGICQVSTTLYNAALNAELEIVERNCHSMTVGYVPLSMDAALAGTWKDLKIQNNTSTPVYIEGIYAPGKITFNIYGLETRPSNRTVQYVSQRVSSSSSYYTSQLLKRVYIDGVLQSESVVNTSSYKNGGGATGSRTAQTQETPPQPQQQETTTTVMINETITLPPETTQAPQTTAPQVPVQTETQPIEQPTTTNQPTTTTQTTTQQATTKETVPQQETTAPMN